MIPLDNFCGIVSGVLLLILVLFLYSRFAARRAARVVNMDEEE